MRNIWMVRAGEGAYLVDEFLSSEMVAIGWNDIGDLTNVSDLDEIKSLLIKAYTSAKKSQIDNYAGQIYRFRFEFKKADNVITYNPSTRKYHMGEITSDYKYSLRNEFHNLRNIKWNFEIDRDSLTTKTKNSLGSVMTIFKVSHYAAEELYNSERTGGQLVIDKQEEDEELGNIKEDTELKAFEFIKDKVQALDWEEMEELVAGILRGMGYKTIVSPTGADRGKDVIASPDGLGLENPKIKVEVKHRNGSIGAPQIRNFIGGLRPTDRGLYVSTGGYSKEANYEAERSNIPITLVDLDMLVKLIIQHYDNFDIDTRTLIPLRKIYWPI